MTKLRYTSVLRSVLGITVCTGLALNTLTLSQAQAEPKGVTLDLENSSVFWYASKVTGAHNGHVKLASAEATVENGEFVGGLFKIDMSSISVDDIQDEDSNKKLQKHLRSEDFFNAEKFAHATFKTTKVEKITGAAADAPNYTITGELTVLGISHPITFPATVKIDGEKVTAKADIQLDRTKWNIRYGSGKFFKSLGDKLIYDEFTIGVNLEGKV